MKLLFLILAHERPQQVAELCETLVAAAEDAVTLVHYDARASEAEFAALEEAVAGNARIRLVERRVACRWGNFGLVEAPLNALSQAEAEGLDPDYAILLSGACLPCRPVAQLERYLAETDGREFIEVEDESWIGDGWRSERWRYRFWFDHKTQHPLEWAFLHLQRLLGLTRNFPEGLSPRFGSQWWALTWETCREILADTRANPERLDFFRSVWIPDEMVFQSYVHALVPPERIAGFGLTHFQFSNRGKPVVFHDDHADYVDTLPRFFFRKADPHADRLRRRCLEKATASDDGAPLDRIGPRRTDYQLKVAAQTHYPRPGQTFYRNQYADMTDTVLAAGETPYVVLVGPPAMTRLLAAGLPDGAETCVLGEVFDPGEVDLGPGQDELGGLRRDDTALRDAHPALYLMRLRDRISACPVMTWSPFHAPSLLEAVLHDRNALVVACLPWTGDERRDRGLLALACRHDQPNLAVAPLLLPEASPEEVLRAQLDTMAAPHLPWLDRLCRHVFYERPLDAFRGRLVAMPWSLGPAEIAPPERRALFERSLNECRFRARPWFSGLRAGLEAVSPEALEQEAAALMARLENPAAPLPAQGDDAGAGADRQLLTEETAS